MNISVGQFNTGCENLVKQRLQVLLPDDTAKAFGDEATLSITVSHCAQPKFNDIAVIMNVHVPMGQFQNSFTVSIDEVRNLRGPALDKILVERSSATVLEIKVLIDKTPQRDPDGH